MERSNYKAVESNLLYNKTKDHKQYFLSDNQRYTIQKIICNIVIIVFFPGVNTNNFDSISDYMFCALARRNISRLRLSI